MYDIDFKSEYIDKDFDAILNKCNNTFVESFDNYIKFKQIYFENTYNNYKNYTELYSKYSELKDKQYIKLSDTKFIYTYIDKNNYNELKNEIKKLLVKQRDLYLNFMSYLDILNKQFQSAQQTTISNTQKTNNKNKNIFLTFLNSNDNVFIQKKRRK